MNKKIDLEKEIAVTLIEMFNWQADKKMRSGRHTRGTLMPESGKPIELISQCPGHSDIRTTQIYLSRISSDKVDTEINDMLNQMLRDTSGPTGKKETEKTGSTPCMDKRKENTHLKRKEFPFLTKKEKIREEEIQNAEKQEYTSLIIKGIKALLKCSKRKPRL